MTTELADYWGRLEGAVHPDDLALFSRELDHGFNLDFPPPAFIGDVVNAPVIILDNNGGYDPGMTIAEFPDGQTHSEFRETLARPRPLDRAARTASRYYLERNFSKWLEGGVAALVNSVAYRSVSGRDKAVSRLTRSLPSAQFHQRWLQQILRPLAMRGERFVVVHRWSRWNGATDVLRGLPTAIFSSAPISKDLTAREISAVEGFLAERRGLTQDTLLK